VKNFSPAFEAGLSLLTMCQTMEKNRGEVWLIFITISVELWYNTF
jgi:hypothetical protein